MKEIDIKWLKNILYSKIDQLATLIWDNFKTVHYDYFSINKENLEENIWKIREIIEKWNWDNLEVLVMKKDIVDLTKDFLDKDIIKELEKERKKLKITRHIYILITLLILWLGVVVYGWYFKLLFENITNTKNNWICYTIHNIATNSLSWNILSGNNIVQLSWNSLSWNILSGNNIVQLSWNSLSWNMTSSITWDFILAKLNNQKYILSWNILQGEIKINSIINNNSIKLNTFKPEFDTSWDKYYLLKYKELQINTWDIFSWTYQLSWTVKDNTIIWKILTGEIVKELDENEEKLQWEELEKYQEEKKEKCPYSGIVKVNVYALNLRESNTKYSKKLAVLKKWTELEVLKCQKNLEADSWWYKVKIVKTGDIWWVSTIWIGQ